MRINNVGQQCERREDVGKLVSVSVNAWPPNLLDTVVCGSCFRFDGHETVMDFSPERNRLIVWWKRNASLNRL